MDKRSVGLFVKMLQEIDEITSRTEEFDITKERWESSRALRDLLLMPLIQIGELTTHFNNDEHRALFPDVPWRDIKGFRNVVVHGYGQIDIDIAWTAATTSVRELRESLLGDPDVCAAYELERQQVGAAADDFTTLIRALPELGEAAGFSGRS